MGAVTEEVASLCGGERELTGGAFADVRLQVQLLELQSMCDILTVDDHNDRLTLLQYDLGGRVAKTLCNNLYPAWRIRGGGGKGQRHAPPRPSHNSQLLFHNAKSPSQ